MFEDAKTYPRPAATPCHLLRSVLAATRLPHFRAVATGLQPRSIRVAPTPIPGATRMPHLRERCSRGGNPLHERYWQMLLLQESTGCKWLNKSPTTPTPPTLRASQIHANCGSPCFLKYRCRVTAARGSEVRSGWASGRRAEGSPLGEALPDPRKTGPNSPCGPSSVLEARGPL